MSNHVSKYVISKAWQIIRYLNDQAKKMDLELSNQRDLADIAKATYVADGGQDFSVTHYQNVRELSATRRHIYNKAIPFIKEEIQKIVSQGWTIVDPIDKKFVEHVKEYDTSKDLYILSVLKKNS